MTDDLRRCHDEIIATMNKPHACVTGNRCNPESPAGTNWWTSLFLGGFVLLCYMANGREMGTDDTLGATLMPLSLTRGEGFALNRFSRILRVGDGLPPFVQLVRGRIISVYPVVPSLLVWPLMAPQIAYLDRRYPTWDDNPIDEMNECKRMAKRSISLLMAVAAVILHRFLLRLGLRFGALPSVLAAFLGSDLWTHASQALWQHGPAALALVLVLALLQPSPVSSWRLVAAGMATTLLFTSRLLDSIFAVVIFAWVISTQRWRVLWFVPIPMLGAVWLLTYNVWLFGTVIGGQAHLELLHPRVHGVEGAWSGNLVEGAAGTLLSPNRGLLVFSPWVSLAVAVALVPSVARRIASHRPIAWLLAALLPYFFLLSKYSVWWGGHCFGARYWTDVIPLFAIVLAFGLEWMRSHFRILIAVSYLTIAFQSVCMALGRSVTLAHGTIRRPTLIYITSGCGTGVIRNFSAV